MSVKFEAWADRQITRDEAGRFAESAIGWARRMADQAHISGRAFHDIHREGARPPGFEEVAGRSHYLWSIPGRVRNERTDEEQEELNHIDVALAKYYDEVGLTLQRYSAYRRQFRDDPTMTIYDPFGNIMESDTVAERARLEKNAPLAAKLGYTRVADIPEDSEYFDGGKEHPLSNGIWLNPRDPGRPSQPNYRSDRGSPYGEMAILEHLADVVPFRPTPRSKKYKEGRADRRIAEFARDVDGNEVEMYTRQASKPGKEKIGAIGHRGNLEMEFFSGLKYESDTARDFKAVKTARGRKKRQRTWIERVNADIERRGSRG